jgi:hypothetical protein
MKDHFWLNGGQKVPNLHYILEIDLPPMQATPSFGTLTPRGGMHFTTLAIQLMRQVRANKPTRTSDQDFFTHKLKREPSGNAYFYAHFKLLSLKALKHQRAGIRGHRALGARHHSVKLYLQE